MQEPAFMANKSGGGGNRP